MKLARSTDTNTDTKAVIVIRVVMARTRLWGDGERRDVGGGRRGHDVAMLKNVVNGSYSYANVADDDENNKEKRGRK